MNLICLESEFSFTPALTQRVRVRTPEEPNGRELNRYGGVIYTLKSRTDVNVVQDLKGKVITASDLKLMQVLSLLALLVQKYKY